MKIHSIFFTQFLPCMIKNLMFRYQVSVASDDNTLCTISDEAFELLLLKNSFDQD
jgi:hypothetical protein